MHCSTCGAEIGVGAKFCGQCGAATATVSTNKRVKTERGAKKDPSETIGAGCAGLLIIAVLIAGVQMCSGSSKTPEQLKVDAAKQADDQRKGFHCLSGWDGSNRSLVDQIKHQLRDPDSFEHDETRITPEKDGKHTVFMRYRAKNGFGGMNVQTAVAEVDHNTCDATIVSTGDE